jgi:hypothetical protein
MRSLLFNLIGNALKYHKKDIDPVIDIYSDTSMGDNDWGAKNFVEFL